MNAGPAVGLDTLVVPGDGTTNVDHVWEIAPDGTVTEETQTGSVENATITAQQGAKVSFVAVPVDQYGNTVVVTDTAPVTTSSIASDRIGFDSTTGLTSILFTHASPHTISYTADGFTGSFTVQVAAVTTTPAAAPTPISTASLAYTGSNPAPALGVAGLLLALGAAFRTISVVRRRKRA